MKKRVICILLVLAMLLTMLPVTALAAKRPTNPFSDVHTWDWFFDSVMYVYVNKLFSGVSDTSFDPGGTMTRGMFVTVLGRLAGVDQEQYQGQSDFADVSPDAYYAPYVAWAAKYGITTGTGGGYFSPNALINRQQMASFCVRYFDVFDREYATDTVVTSEQPVDFDQVADWAKEDVKLMWQTGVLVGDGINFDPYANATRAQAATLCERLDEAVKTWYKELGVKSERVRLDPKTGEPYGVGLTLSSVSFYDGDRLIDVLTTLTGTPLSELPDVELSSKEGEVLLGYYYDKAFTEPFYAENNVWEDIKVYAKYRKMDTVENLTVRTFTQMDASADLSFTIEKNGSSGVSAEAAATVQSKDGSDPVELAVSSNGNGTYRVYAPKGFNEGCSYELTLADGWVFSGKEPTIRTASFSIAKDEVFNLEMGEDIVYLEDTASMDYSVDGGSYEVLTSDVLALLLNENTGKAGEGSFGYANSGIKEGDVLCIYTGTHPLERKMNSDVLKPAVYVKASKDATASTVYFTAMDQEAQQELYELPDNFPINVPALPTAAEGSVSLTSLDIPMYESMVGVNIGTLNYARERLSEGDFVTLYVSTLEKDLIGDGSDLYFGRIERFENDTLYYTRVTKQDIIDSMELYTKIDLEATDFIGADAMNEMELQVQAQLESSRFAEEAVYMLANLTAESQEFQQNARLTDANGNRLSEAQLNLLGSGGFTIQDLDLDVDVGTGSRYQGVEIAIDLHAELEVDTADGTLVVALTASFLEEAMVSPSVMGDLVYKEILEIPIPIGVHVTANIDVMNFTGFSFAAELTTVDNSGKILSTTSIASDLEDLMTIAEEEGLDDSYFQSLEALLEKYQEMLRKETDWIKLVEQEIFAVEMCVYGIAIGVETDFVVRTDMSVAIGSSLEYEMGKRYSFWFKIGLFTPTAGSDTMDLIDEQFAFQFYVLGKLGIKAGIKAKLYVGLGSGKLANVGIAAELGPYVKLRGLFIYDYNRTRPAGSSTWNVSSSMIGGLNLEFGLYIILNFEAEALDCFSYTYDFFNQEIPLLESGENRFYYELFYTPQSDEEKVIVWDEDRDSTNGITMDFPEKLRALKYIDLSTGVSGASVRPYENFSVTLSNPKFTLDSNGKITVTPSDTDLYLQCDVTITYLHGKHPFSRYDMTTTVPIVWTTLSVSELKEYKTVSVLVGDGKDYEEVWTTRVLKGQSFDLPAESEIKALIGWNDLIYTDASGYTTSQTKGLTVTTDTNYYFDVAYKTYAIYVNGIETDKGTAPSVYYARYGETFDFSLLENTYGERPAEGYFTRFKDVTTTGTIPTEVAYNSATGSFAVAHQPIDLTQPITGEMAKALYNNTGAASDPVVATANYVDDSVTAVFTFNGLTHANVEDKVFTLRKGTKPDAAVKQVEEYLRAEVLKNNGEWVGINDIYPTPDFALDCSTNFIVTCLYLSGERRMIRFVSEGYTYTGCEETMTCTAEVPCQSTADCTHITGCYHFYHEPEPLTPVDKLVGALIVNLPSPERRGYTFTGWVTDTGKPSVTQRVPAEGITLYATYTPNDYLVKFDLNTLRDTSKVAQPNDMVVTYDTTYGEGYVPAVDANNKVVGKTDTAYTYTNKAGTVIDGLPILDFTADQAFLGWSTQPDRFAEPDTPSVDNPAEVHVLDETTAHIHADYGHMITDAQNNPTNNVDLGIKTYGHTLYAQWKDLVDVNAEHASKTIFYVNDPQLVYDGLGHKVQIQVKSSYLHETYENKPGIDTPYATAFADINDPENSSFTITYKRQGYLTEWENTAVNAGTYDVRIQRAGDGNFKAIDLRLIGAFTIAKAPSTLTGTPTSSNVTQYKANLLTNTSGLSYSVTRGSGTGIGTYQFAVTSSNSEPDEADWTSGAIYNVNQGVESDTFYLWARVGPGENYAASEPKSCQLSLTDNPGNLTYRLIVKTTDGGALDMTGTDSDVYVSFNGGGEIHLTNCIAHENCNKFEDGNEDVFEISGLSSSGTASVVLRKAKDSSLSEGWDLDWIRVDVYEGGTLLGEGTQLDGKVLENDTLTLTGTLEYPSITCTYTVSGPSSVTLSSGSSTTVSVDASAGAYDHYGAPKFEAYFNERGFDRFISWSFDEDTDSWYATFNHAAVLAEMDVFGYEELVFRYGVYDPENHAEAWNVITIKRPNAATP